jgi:hypothetical protein
MELNSFFYSLTADERVRFADSIGYSVPYIRNHLIPKNSEPDRLPPLPKLRKIAEATDGIVSFEQVCSHFEQVQAA